MKQAMKFTPYQKVLVRGCDGDTWTCDWYSHYNERLGMHVIIGSIACKNIIPYEGNEHLLGTTDSPKPNRWRAEMGKLYYFIDATFCANREEDIYTPMDNYRHNIGNYFRTKEEAQAMADRFKAILKGE